MGERNDLAGKAALVTGAAGAIGAATVKLLLERGASVAAVDRPGVSFAPLIAACGEAENLVTLEADVSDEGQVADYVSLARQAFGRIDIFFNNAGIEGVVKTVPDYPLEEFQKVMSVNVIGVFLGMKHVIPVMAAQGGGPFGPSSRACGIGNSHGTPGPRPDRPDHLPPAQAAGGSRQVKELRQRKPRLRTQHPLRPQTNWNDRRSFAGRARRVAATQPSFH